MKIPQKIYKSLFFLLSFFSLLPTWVWAYRPFISTDAEVANLKKWEMEIGVFTISKGKGEREIRIPSVRANYGIFKNCELVAETDVQIDREGEERDLELIEPGLFLKSVCQEGFLQSQKGASVAYEVGVLLPSTLRGERDAGLEAVGIVSTKVRDFILHFNAGGELNRGDFDPVGLWGIIGEFPVGRKLRFVGE